MCNIFQFFLHFLWWTIFKMNFQNSKVVFRAINCPWTKSRKCFMHPGHKLGYKWMWIKSHFDSNVDFCTENKTVGGTFSNTFPHSDQRYHNFWLFYWMNHGDFIDISNLPNIFPPFDVILWLLISRISLGEQARAMVVVDIINWKISIHFFCALFFVKFNLFSVFSSFFLCFVFFLQIFLLPFVFFLLFLLHFTITIQWKTKLQSTDSRTFEGYYGRYVLIPEISNWINYSKQNENVFLFLRGNVLVWFGLVGKRFKWMDFEWEWKKKLRWN